MVRMIFWFAVLVAITLGVTWLADSPGEFSMVVRGYRIETQSIGLVAFALAASFVTIWIAWGIFKWLIGRPSALGNFFSNRREKKGRAALSTGLIAIGAGDEKAAKKAALVAERMLPDDPLAQLLAAQSAQSQGDSARVKQVYQQMSRADDTKLLGLRGLFNEARREKNIEAARQIAKDALKENPGVSWASNAMLVSYAADKDWPAVLLLLENQRVAKLIDKKTANAKKAVALTAQALEAENKDHQAAIELAIKAHRLDPSLVEAAVIAGRNLATEKAVRKASKILEKTWALSPHPDIAEVYAYAKQDASPTERLNRVKALLKRADGGQEGAKALAQAAIEAQSWETARKALSPYLEDKPSAGICTLMATIENAELGNKGRAREWLARAVHAPRDAAWTSGGFVSEKWLPVSPVTGELGGFEWKVPVLGLGVSESTQEKTISPFLPGKETPQAAPEEITDIKEAIIEDADVKEVIDVTPAPQEDKTPLPETDKAKVSPKKGDTAEKPSTRPESAEDLPAPPPTPDVPSSNNANKSKSGLNHLPDDPGPKKPEDKKSGESWFG